MDNNIFDEHAVNYNQILENQLQFFDDGDYFTEYKVLKIKDFLTTTPKTILDFGCGVGRSTLFLQKYFPNAETYGYDVSEASLVEAKKQAPSAHFLTAQELPQLEVTFDLIFVSNVFHHIEPKERAAVMASLVRMSRPGTLIIIFEHNPLNPVTRYLVNTCPFDKDAVLLWPRELKRLFLQAGVSNLRSQYTLFFPACLKWLRFLERYLWFLPLGGQYVVGGFFEKNDWGPVTPDTHSHHASPAAASFPDKL